MREFPLTIPVEKTTRRTFFFRAQNRRADISANVTPPTKKTPTTRVVVPLDDDDVDEEIVLSREDIFPTIPPPARLRVLATPPDKSLVLSDADIEVELLIVAVDDEGELQLSLITNASSSGQTVGMKAPPKTNASSLGRLTSYDCPSGVLGISDSLLTTSRNRACLDVVLPP